MSNEGELKPIPDKCFCGAKMIYVTSMNDTMHNLKCCNPAHSIVITASKAKLIEILEYIYNNTRPAQSSGWIDVKDSPDCTERFIVTVEDADEELWVTDSLYRYVESERYGYWEIEVKGKVKVKAYMDLPQPYTPAPEANDE